MAWHRARLRGDAETDLAAETSALAWSIAAMTDSVRQLPAVRAWDQPQAFAIVAEAVWRTTIVDATLIRHYPETYDALMARQPVGQRRLVEGTLAGLRFVRNQMAHERDHAGFIRQAALGATPGDGHGAGPLATWAWRPVPEPPTAMEPGGGRSWARARYQAYQEFLVGRRIGETFGPAAAFLTNASAAAADISGTASAAGR